MKKIIIGLILLNLINFKVYGETYTIPLTYKISPTYTITIPKEVDITNNQTSFNFSVSGDIYYDSYLEVMFANEAAISNNSYTGIVYVNQDKTNFSYSDVINTSSATVNLSHGDLKPGKWTGELTLMISLKEGATQ